MTLFSVSELLDAGEWPSVEYVELMVCAVENPGHFWVHIVCEQGTRLDTLQKQMTEYYGNTDVNLVV